MRCFFSTLISYIRAQSLFPSSDVPFLIRFHELLLYLKYSQILIQGFLFFLSSLFNFQGAIAPASRECLDILPLISSLVKNFFTTFFLFLSTAQRVLSRPSYILYLPLFPTLYIFYLFITIYPFHFLNWLEKSLWWDWGGLLFYASYITPDVR